MRMVYQLAAACAALVLLAPAAHAEFDWGGSCDEGDGAFQQDIPYYQTAVVGKIPVGKKDVAIYLKSPADVDIQLVDATDGTKIIHWPSGLLSGPNKASVTYKGATYEWSGYNGDGVNLGHEYIKIHGVTDRPLIMRAFGYKQGFADVTYSWSADPSCNEKGSGSFVEIMPYYEVQLVGDIPPGKANVEVRLTAENDLDIQLFDGDTAIVQWPNGILAGAKTQQVDYKGMTIEWSGYNGDGTGLGNEYIKIIGVTTTTLTMKVFAYKAGKATVDYKWGEGVGQTCMGIAALQCPEGLFCKGVQVGVADAAGTCHTENWCHPDSVQADCANVPHIAVPGTWSCQSFQCVWQTGPPTVGEGDACGANGMACGAGLYCKGKDLGGVGLCVADQLYCEPASVLDDCAEVLHPAVPGRWSCESQTCAWRYWGTFQQVDFEDLLADPKAYTGDGQTPTVELTWTATKNPFAACTKIACPDDPADPTDQCCNMCSTGMKFVGASANGVTPEVSLSGIGCQGNECNWDQQCDFFDGSLLTVWGRLFESYGQLHVEVYGAQNAN